MPYMRKKPARRPRRKAPSRYPRVQGKGNVVKASGPQAGTTVLAPWLPIFPARTVRRLRYSDNIQLTSTAGAVASYVFAANGLYDPNITGTGHQPMGFDQMMLFYNHYCVTKAKMIIVAQNASTVPCQLVLRQDAGSTPLTVIDRILEMGGMAYTHLDTTANSNAQKELILSIDLAKAQGISPFALTANPSLRGSSAANPAELTYFIIQLFSAAGFTTTVNIDVLIEFESYFLEPLDQAAS